MSKLREILKTAGEARDPILVVVSFTYVLGFLVWSFQAWREGLGLLPIANTRYFIAGLPILCILIAAYSLLHARHWLKEWALCDAPHRVRILNWLAGTVMIVVVVMQPLSEVGIQRWGWSMFTWEAYVTFKGMVILLFLILLLVLSELSARVKRSKMQEWTLRVFILGSVLLNLTGLISLVDEVYPTLPQEFGGFKPRVAVLHLRVSALSRSLRLSLVAQPDDKTAEVCESKEVLVFYADKERLIVKVRPDPTHRSVAEVEGGVAYELRPDVVSATTYLK